VRRRLIENLVAFVLSLLAVEGCLSKCHLATEAAKGLLAGVCVPFVVSVYCPSVNLQALLLFVVVILICTKFGLVALGTSLLGYALFFGLLGCLLILVNKVRRTSV
jgi:hypothetical protein